MNTQPIVAFNVNIFLIIVLKKATISKTSDIIDMTAAAL
jgi:hypothetical protein